MWKTRPLSAKWQGPTPPLQRPRRKQVAARSLGCLKRFAKLLPASITAPLERSHRRGERCRGGKVDAGAGRARSRDGALGAAPAPTSRGRPGRPGLICRGLRHCPRLPAAAGRLSAVRVLCTAAPAAAPGRRARSAAAAVRKRRPAARRGRSPSRSRSRPRRRPPGEPGGGARGASGGEGAGSPALAACPSAAPRCGGAPAEAFPRCRRPRNSGRGVAWRRRGLCSLPDPHAAARPRAAGLSAAADRWQRDPGEPQAREAPCLGAGISHRGTNPERIPWEWSLRGEGRSYRRLGGR